MSAAAILRRLAPFAIVATALTGPFLAARAEIPWNERHSGYDDMSADNKAMEDDDTANPAMLSVLDGEALVKVPTRAEADPLASRQKA